MSSAEDAFGVVVGREHIGIYASNSVRGFSPLAAGNARIDGLYFDPVFAPNDRIAKSTTIRVGLAAQGYPFAAPTGIVDYQLRHPDPTFSASASASVDAWGATSAELDGNFAVVPQRLAVGVAGLAVHEEFGDGTSDDAWNVAAVASWKPDARLEVLPFISLLGATAIQTGPIYVVDGEGLPPRLPTRRFDGPFSPEGTLKAELIGSIARLELTPRLKVSAGAFFSAVDSRMAVTNIRLIAAGASSFDQILIVEPPSRTSSTSGEVRAVQDFGRLGRVLLTGRARSRRSGFGGSDVLELGRFSLGDRVQGRSDGFTFGRQSVDRVEQSTLGLGYEGSWRTGSLGVGLLKTWYRKSSSAPGTSPVLSRDAPWLISATAAKRLADDVFAYGSFIQGLEESPSAPGAAANRGEPVPAIRTRQIDGGVRWAIRPGLSLVFGAFELRKPYFDIDAANLYRELGQVTNRGVEFSFAGKLTSRLNVVAGSLVQHPRLAGQAVDAGSIGSRPTNLPARLIILNGDWRLPGSDSLSIDAAFKWLSARPATTSGRTFIPARATLGLGGRYRFKIAEHAAVLRAQLSNLTNTRGFELAGAGAYAVSDGRTGSLYLSVDY